jgi:hypothetical protein
VKVGIDRAERGNVPAISNLTLLDQIRAQRCDKRFTCVRSDRHHSNALSLDELSGTDYVFRFPIRDRDDQRPLLRVEAHPTFRLETQKRLTHRRSAHIGPSGDVTLADQLPPASSPERISSLTSRKTVSEAEYNIDTRCIYTPRWRNPDIRVADPNISVQHGIDPASIARCQTEEESVHDERRTLPPSQTDALMTSQMKSMRTLTREWLALPDQYDRFTRYLRDNGLTTATRLLLGIIVIGLGVCALLNRFSPAGPTSTIALFFNTVVVISCFMVGVSWWVFGPTSAARSVS